MALRKMLGDIYSDECQQLMRLIETQSHETLNHFAYQYATKHYLKYVDMDWLNEGVKQCEDYLKGNITLKEIKVVLKEMRSHVSKVKEPISQAVARAIVTALSTINTPTNALGFLFYGAACYAYTTAGLKATQDVYDRLAIEELNRALDYLKSMAVENETNSVKVNWHC